VEEIFKVAPTTDERNAFIVVSSRGRVHTPPTKSVSTFAECGLWSPFSPDRPTPSFSRRNRAGSRQFGNHSSFLLLSPSNNTPRRLSASSREMGRCVVREGQSPSLCRGHGLGDPRRFNGGAQSRDVRSTRRSPQCRGWVRQRIGMPSAMCNSRPAHEGGAVVRPILIRCDQGVHRLPAPEQYHFQIHRRAAGASLE